MSQETRTVCKGCAKRLEILQDYLAAWHNVLAGFGADSVCDMCGEENGGAVLSVEVLP